LALKDKERAEKPYEKSEADATAKYEHLSKLVALYATEEK